ncbi:MAG TPA: prepilin-type N-terminal cleavage/methylation domain-containing protein, partial [Patescibacteria group bacterium]|nr:prepilin-type N-terminal cleavage/methylation domain-containing protein [Patescibacteria group bacterium]
IKKTKNNGNNKGFTLVETLVYVGVLGLVLSSFIGFVLSIGNMRNKVYVQQEVQANARQALHLISQSVLSADAVNLGASTFDSDPGVLSLQMDESVDDPTIIDLTADDGILRLTKGTSSPLAVTSDEVKITNLVFTDLTSIGNKENIKIELSVEYDSDGNGHYKYSQSWQTAVSLRE